MLTPRGPAGPPRLGVGHSRGTHSALQLLPPGFPLTRCPHCAAPARARRWGPGAPPVAGRCGGSGGNGDARVSGCPHPFLCPSLHASCSGPSRPPFQAFLCVGLTLWDKARPQTRIPAVSSLRPDPCDPHTPCPYPQWFTLAHPALHTCFQTPGEAGLPGGSPGHTLPAAWPVC